MMKNFRHGLTIIVIMIMCSLQALGETPLRVQNFEGEVFGGLTAPLDNQRGMSSAIGINCGLEMRYNFRNRPFDVGFQLGLMDVQHNCKYITSEGILDKDIQVNNVWELSAVGDYNLRQGKRINPFCGVGLGIGIYDGGDRVHCEGASFLVTPRIGVELVHHIRITGSFGIIRKGFNSFNLSIGFVLGGRPKK